MLKNTTNIKVIYKVINTVFLLKKGCLNNVNTNNKNNNYN